MDTMSIQYKTLSNVWKFGQWILIFQTCVCVKSFKQDPSFSRPHPLAQAEILNSLHCRESSCQDCSHSFFHSALVVEITQASLEMLLRLLKVCTFLASTLVEFYVIDGHFHAEHSFDLFYKIKFFSF